jgi:hypothetical protein
MTFFWDAPPGRTAELCLRLPGFFGGENLVPGIDARQIGVFLGWGDPELSPSVCRRHLVRAGLVRRLARADLKVQASSSDRLKPEEKR